MRALRTSASALALLSALITTMPVSAQQFDKTFYIGAGALASELEPRVNQSNFQVTESLGVGGQLFIGGDLAKYLTIEGYYRYLGESELSRDAEVGTIQYQTAGVSGLLYLASTRGNRGLRNRTGLMLYGRAGIGYLENTSDDIEFIRLQSTHFATGIGLEYGFKNGFALRAEFVNHDVDARDLSFNLVKRFGRRGELDLTPETSLPVMPEPPAAVVTPAVPEEAVPEETAVVAEAPPPPPLPDWDEDDDGIIDKFDQCEKTAPGSLVDAKGCAFAGILKGLTFASGSAELTDEATRTLDEVARALAANPVVEISVESHTDNRGRAQSNMDLSRRRASAVVTYLADVGGVDLARMSAVGYGESRPVQSNRSASGRQANRRVEISVK